MPNPIIRTWRVIERVLQNPLVMLTTMAVSMTSFGIALQAQHSANEATGRVAQVAQARAEEAQRSNEFLRITFCDVFQPIAEAGKEPTTIPRTAIGIQLLDASARVAENLQCTPDPYDHR